jgi:hypothetical protein
VLRAAHDLGLPSVNSSQWLDFNEARRAVTVETLQWDGERLVLALQAPVVVEGLTLLLPPWNAGRPLAATVGGLPCEVAELSYEGLRWLGLVADLPAQARIEVAVAPRT